MAILDAWKQRDLDLLSFELDQADAFCRLPTDTSVETERQELLSEVTAHIRQSLGLAQTRFRRPEFAETDLLLLMHLIRSR